MENFENIPQNSEPQVSKPQQPASPFADSPYIMEPVEEPAEPIAEATEAPISEAVSEPVVSKPVKKGRSKKVLLSCIAGILVIALVAIGCGVTALSVNSYWDHQNRQMMAYMQQQLAKLEQQRKRYHYNNI